MVKVFPLGSTFVGASVDAEALLDAGSAKPLHSLCKRGGSPFLIDRSYSHML